MARAALVPVYTEVPSMGIDGRTVLSGAVAPTSTVGRIGDFYVDLVGKKLYGPKNASGWPDNGLIKGDRGWVPVLASVTDSTRRVFRVVDWSGGEGAKPATGKYVGATGLVDLIADAVDMRGAEGPEMLIDTLDDGADDVTYDDNTAAAKEGDDNKRQPLKRILGAGGSLEFETIADASALSVPASVKTVKINGEANADGGPGQIRRRVDSEPSSVLKHRSVDRFTSDGGTDAANGGWWEAVAYSATNAQALAGTDPKARMSAKDAKDSINLNAELANFTPAGTGAVARPIRTKLRETVVVPEDFSAVGNGSTDDATALTRFWNSAIANPGLLHRIPRKQYATSAAMPTIAVDDVRIEGAGFEIHDVGALVTGSSLKWIGTVGATTPLVSMTPTPGPSNQRLSGVRLKGFAVDCVSGNLEYGISLRSCWHGDFDIGVLNAGDIGLILGVEANLGEAPDFQKNRVRYRGRQIESPGALSMTLIGGDAPTNGVIGNVSKNEIWADISHKDITAIYCVNSDNNDWMFVRTNCVAGGAATDGVALLGGAASGARARAERFHHFAGNKPIHAYGTGDFTVPSTGHALFNLDVENGSPVPQVDTGASLSFRRGTDELSGNPWVAFENTPTAHTGTLGAGATVEGEYLKRGPIVHVRAKIAIPTEGTGSVGIIMTLPIPSIGTYGTILLGQERALTGKAVVGDLEGGSDTTVFIRNYDASDPVASGIIITISGFYRCAP